MENRRSVDNDGMETHKHDQLISAIKPKKKKEKKSEKFRSSLIDFGLVSSKVTQVVLQRFFKYFLYRNLV